MQRSARLREHEQPGGPPALPARLLAPLPGQPVHRSGVLLTALCAEPRAQPAPGEQRAGEDGRAGEPPRVARPQPGRV